MEPLFKATTHSEPLFKAMTEIFGTIIQGYDKYLEPLFKAMTHSEPLFKAMTEIFKEMTDIQTIIQDLDNY